MKPQSYTCRNSFPRWIAAFSLIGAGNLVPLAGLNDPLPADTEWDAQRALKEWPDQRGIWAPVTWPDHRDEFNVLFNGTIVASDYCRYGWRQTVFGESPETGFSLKIDFHDSPDVARGDAREVLKRYPNPDGMHRSSWGHSIAPVYVVEHQLPAVLIEQRQFAHIPGSARTERGDEPLFIWMRCEITDVIGVLNDLERISCVLTPLSEAIRADNDAYNSFVPSTVAPPYGGSLVFSGDGFPLRAAVLRRSDSTGGRSGFLVLPPQPDRDLDLAWLSREPADGAGTEIIEQNFGYEHARVGMPCRVGARFDLLFPYRPVDDEVLERELALGFDGALAEAERFWEEQLRTETVYRVPERLVQGHLNHFAPLSFMISEMNPEFGYPVLLTSSFKYRVIWATPNAITLTALDRMGYHDHVARYLNAFRMTQGAVKPPSPYLGNHSGYLGTPREYESLRDWLTDHGAVLYAAAFHGRLTMDPAFLSQWIDPIVRACEWIEHARNRDNHDGIVGILPAGVANDKGHDEQQVWNDAWTYKGLAESVRLLKRLDHPRWPEIQGWAEDYRSDFQRAMREAVEKSRTWVAPNGDEVPFIPTALGHSPRHLEKHFFYLDSGPMVLVWSGLMDAADPIMQANVRWYREGPQWRQYRRYSRHRQVPVLDREISSCEPCYSWVFSHTLQLGDRHRFSMGFYGLLAGGASQQTYVSSESWETIFGTSFSSAFMIHLMVESALEERGDELHLMRMLPLAFLRDGGFSWHQVPTGFGPLSLEARLNEEETVLEIRFDPPVRLEPEAIFLHPPPIRGLEALWINSESVAFTGKPIRLN